MNLTPYVRVSARKSVCYARMSEAKTEQKTRPYVERGARLRARKEERIRQGLLPNDLGKIAKQAGVSKSGFQQWERGETWPRDWRRAKLAEIMGWSEQELDHGTQPASLSHAESDDEMPLHPVSADELELLALYRGLEDQKSEAKRILSAKLHARHVSQQHVKGPLRPLTDKQVEHKMPITEKKHTLPGKRHKKT